METEIRQIPIVKLQRAPYNPRTILINGSDIELDSSIRAEGIIDPLIVRALDHLDNHYEIVCGNRRYDSATRSEFQAVPCIVREYSDERAREVALIENLQRESMHPLDEAREYAALLSVTGEFEKVAVMVSKTKRYVMARIKLESLDPKVKEKFLKGKFGVEVASQLSRVSPSIQVEVLKRAEQFNDVTANRIQDGIMRSLRDLNLVPWKLDDNSLNPRATCCIECPKRTGAAPELFPEIKKNDSCTDSECFEVKMRSFIAQRVHELGQEKFVKIATDWTEAPKHMHNKILNRHQYREVLKDKCEHQLKGLVVYGEERGKTKTVCPNSKCRIHWMGGGSALTDKERETRVTARRQKDHDRRLKLSVMESIINKAGKDGNADTQIARLVARSFLNRMEHESTKQLCGYLGIKPKKTSWGGKDFAAVVGKTIDDGKGPALTVLMIRMALFSLPVSGFNSEYYDTKRAAKLFSVDMNSLSQKVTREMKKPPKVAAKKKAKK